MSTEKVTIAELSIDLDAVLKDGADYLKLIDRIKSQQKELDKTTADGAESFAKLDAQLKNVQTQYRDNRKLTQTLLEVNKDLTATLAAEGKTTQELYRDRGKLLALSKNIKGDTKEEQGIREKLNKAIDAQTEALRKQSSSYATGKDSVGEYRQAIEEALGSNTLLGRSYATVKQGLETVRPLLAATTAEIRAGVDQIKNYNQGTEGMAAGQKLAAQATGVTSGALRVFRAALIATGIGAIVVALGSLVSFLGSTQKGIDAVTKVTRPLSFIFARLQGILQEVGERLFDAFSNPQETIKRLGTLIKENIQNRLAAVGKIGEAVGKIIKSGFTDGFEDLKDAILQGATGVENFEDKARAAFGAVGDQIKQAVKNGQEYDALLKQIEREEIKQIERQSKLSLEAKKANLVAEDTTKSLAERESAAIRARDIQLELIKGEKNLNDLRVKAIELKQKQNDTTREEEKELAELQAANRRFEESRIEAQTTFNNKLNTIRGERQRLIEKALQEEADAEEAARLEREKKRSEELEAIREFEDRKKAIEDELALQRETDAQAREELRAEQEFERREAELEKLQLNAEQERELLGLLETQKQQTLAEIRQRFEDENFERMRAVQEKEMQLREANAQEQAAIARQAAGLLTGLLGKSLGAQLAALGLQAFVDAGLVKVATASAQARNLAQATASAPPPFNIPFILQAGVQNAALAAQSTRSVSKILAGAALKGFGSIATKFADGGLMEIGGHRHSAGGTKFMGEDGTRFEAERGELIGVMSRPAASAFMKFNDQFKRGTTRRGFYEAGGVFSAGSSLVQSSFRGGSGGGAQVPGMDYERLAEALASKINNQKIVLPVPSLNQVQRDMTEVESAANV